MWKKRAVRVYLVFAAVQGFGIGLTGLLIPAEMQIPLRLTPLNARFVAALYVAGGVGVLLAAASPSRAPSATSSSPRVRCAHLW
jgi:hypothetical protein